MATQRIEDIEEAHREATMEAWAREMTPAQRSAQKARERGLTSGDVGPTSVVVEAEEPVVEGADDLVALAAQIEARREGERRALDEELDAAFAALVDPEARS